MQFERALSPVQEARALIEGGRANEAALLLQRVISAAPHDGDLYLALSYALEKLDQLDEAITAAARAADLIPHNVNIVARVGFLRLIGGHFAAAESTMASVLSLQGQLAGWHHIMGIAMERQGKIEAALHHATEAVRFEPGDYNRTHRIGVLALKADRAAEAEAAFRRAIALRPNTPDYYDSLAIALAQQDRFDEAMEAASRAIELDPASPVWAARLQEVGARAEAARNMAELIRVVDSITLKLLPQNYGSLMFSQFGEDGVLWPLLRTVKDGFYVDIGANHPLRLNNTARLHFYNAWSGINVDADQRYIDEFNRVRPDDINICCGAGAQAGTASMAIFADGTVNSFDPSEIENSQTKGGRVVTERREIHIRTLADILDTHLPVGKTIDLLNIDAEGWDTAILEANNWTRYRPGLILVEDHTMILSNVERSATYRLLRSCGYELFSKTLATSFYRPAG